MTTQRQLDDVYSTYIQPTRTSPQVVERKTFFRFLYITYNLDLDRVDLFFIYVKYHV